MRNLTIAGIVLMVVGPLGAMLGIVPPFGGFGAFALGGLVAVVAAIGGIVSLVRGRGAGTLAIAIVPAAIFVASFATGMGPPPINDITTNVDDPPSFVNAPTIPANAGRDFAYGADLREVVRASYPDVKSLRLAEPAAAAYERALAKARAQTGWEITREDRAALTFEGVATSRVFRFRDDFIVRVKSEGEGATIDMRSKSRDGIGDRGVNAARIRAFFAELTS